MHGMVQNLSGLIQSSETWPTGIPQRKPMHTPCVEIPDAVALNLRPLKFPLHIFVSL